MPYIPLTRGKQCLVDDDVFELLKGFKWCVSNGYAVRRHLTPKGVRHMYIHKFVAGVTGDEEVTPVVMHKNGDPLDCRRENILRTTRQVCQQRMAARTETGFKGVTLHRGKYTAHIGVGGKTKHLGRFTEKHDAARAYDQHAYWYYGDHARLNFEDAESIERYKRTPREDAGHA